MHSLVVNVVCLSSWSGRFGKNCLLYAACLLVLCRCWHGETEDVVSANDADVLLTGNVAVF